MTGPEKSSEADGSARTANSSNVALEVSLALYEDSKLSNPSMMASAISSKIERSVDFSTLQFTREMNGERAYPDNPLLNKPINLDEQTAKDVLNNPLTKQALPYATIGFLYDNYDSIKQPSTIDRITVSDLRRFRDSNADANPLEKAMIDYSIENFGELHALTNGEINRYTLPQMSRALHVLQRGLESNEHMEYLQKNYFKIDKSNESAGITEADIIYNQDRTMDFEEFKSLESVRENLDVLSRFNTADGATHNGMLRLMPPSRGNASGVTAADIGAWKSNLKFLDHLGLKADSSVDSYYRNARATFNYKSIADQILSPTQSP